MKLDSANRIFMLGIAGTGMRGLAYLLRAKGKTVAGSDIDADALKELSEYETASEGEAASLLEDADVLIYTDAVNEGHVLRTLAREKGIPQMSYQEAVGEFAKNYEVIAVAGVHGKSSTAAFLSHIMIEAGLDPTVLIGASMSSLEGKHARLGKGKYMVVEADEYREHFLALRPAYAIVTNIDFDHPDFFDSKEEVEELFEKFKVQVAGEIIAEAETMVVSSPLPGKHMKRNAALAVAMAQVLGIDRFEAIDSLKSFSGLARRFEVVGTIKSTEIVSDYGHHPVAIAATLRGAKEKYEDKRIAVLFEAHMLERLEEFFDDFVSALALADFVLIYPPFVPKGRSMRDVADMVDRLFQALQKEDVVAEILRTSAGLENSIKGLTQEYGVIVAFTAGPLDADLRGLVS